MKNILNIFTKLAFVSCVLFLISHLSSLISTIHAQEKSNSPVLSVSPIIINVPLSPGKLLNKEITIQNMTDSPLPLRASLNDFQTTGEEGGYVFEDSRTNPLLSWITLSDTDLILAPKEKKTILATIKTPNEIPLGGYYGMLFFEVVPQSVTAEATRIVPKIGVLMLANVGVPDPNAKKAEILTYETGLFQNSTTIPLLLRVKNISLHFFTAKPIVTISPLLPLFPQSSNPMYLEEKIVFQGNIRRWNQAITLPNEFPNIYKAHMVVATGNGENVTQDTYFVLLPTPKVVLAGLIFVFLILVTLWRKRLLRAIKILVSNKN